MAASRGSGLWLCGTETGGTTLSPCGRGPGPSPTPASSGCPQAHPVAGDGSRSGRWGAGQLDAIHGELHRPWSVHHALLLVAARVASGLTWPVSPAMRVLVLFLPAGFYWRRSYDQAAIKFRSVDADIDFSLDDYKEDVKKMSGCSKEEFIQVLRR